VVLRITKGVAQRYVDAGFRWGQVGGASLISLSHGTNDAQKTMGVITLALIASFNAIGGLIGPPVLGQVAKMWSLATVFGVLAVMCVVMAWNARVLRQRVAEAAPGAASAPTESA